MITFKPCQRKHFKKLFVFDIAVSLIKLLGKKLAEMLSFKLFGSVDVTPFINNSV